MTPARDATKTIKISISHGPRKPVAHQPRKAGNKLGRSFGYFVVFGCLAWLLWVTFTR